MSSTTPPPRKIRVLVVDDHPLMREGIAATIDAEPDMTVVAQAGDGVQAIECFERYRPDITLMDLQMSKMDGVTAIEVILRRHPGARILVLTTYKGDAQATRAVNAGACGYLLKSMVRQDLVAALRASQLGRRQIVPEVAAAIGMHAFDDRLSEREVEVLKAISNGGANKQIAVQLNLSEQTIKTHVRSILSKLSAQDRTHAVTIALERGIITNWDRQ